MGELMKTFYFDTGVRPETVHSPPFAWDYHKRIGNVVRDTLLIPFQCEGVPENAIFKFACDFPEADKSGQLLVVPIVGGNMLSKYAFFKVTK
jgi:hypothetical protein